MELQVKKIDGTNSSKIEVDNSVFGIEPNDSVVHQTIIAELANRRHGTHSAKSRGMVKGGGRKPWRQKGRGVARAGTTRSPLWKGGGVVFGPEPHKYTKKVPKKMRRLARKSVLSYKTAKNEILVVEELQVTQPKTKEFLQILKALGIADKKVKVLPGVIDDKLFLALRNLKNVSIVKATDASTYDLIDNEVLLFDKAGLALLNEQLGANA